jgi:plastocyanin
MRLLLTALAALSGLPLAALADTHVVTVEGMAFVPASITVRRGDTVVWKNTDLTPHTATAQGRFDSGNIAPQASWTWKAQEPGRLPYVCLYHLGMKGEVIVQ